MFDALGPSVSAEVAPDGLKRSTPLRCVLGLSVGADGSVKKVIGTSERGVMHRSSPPCQGLTRSFPSIGNI